jgi:hypothetical protein
MERGLNVAESMLSSKRQERGVHAASTLARTARTKFSKGEGGRPNKINRHGVASVGADEKRWRATAVQDAGAFTVMLEYCETAWSAPVLWRFGRPGKIGFTLALISAFSLGEKAKRLPPQSKTRDWIGYAVIQQSGNGQNAFPLLGERARVREDVQTNNI